MPSEHTDASCRLCRAPVRPGHQRQLCDICDEYAQLVALQSNKHFERILGEVQNGALFVAATRNAH